MGINPIFHFKQTPLLNPHIWGLSRYFGWDPTDWEWHASLGCTQLVGITRWVLLYRLTQDAISGWTMILNVTPNILVSKTNSSNCLITGNCTGQWGSIVEWPLLGWSDNLWVEVMCQVVMYGEMNYWESLVLQFYVMDTGRQFHFNS